MSEPLLSMNDSIANSADPEFDVFLSHNSKEKPTVKRIAEKLRRAGIKPWLDIWHLPDGGDWQTGLANGLRASSACAVFIGRHDVGDWQRLEQQFATDRMAKDRAFRVFLVLLPGLPDPFDTGTLPPFLTLRNWVDLRKGIEDARAFQSLINAIKGVPSDSERSPEPRNDICPYRGLQTFDEEHAEFFFGRDGDIQRLVEKLKGTRFLAVLGPSGSGKSSLVRAGLIPAIRKGQLSDSAAWPIQVFTPTAHPLTQLAANLLRLYPQGTMNEVLNRMLADERTLHLDVARAMADRKSDERAVFVIDQFEEFFTLCPNDTERAKFSASLQQASLPQTERQEDESEHVKFLRNLLYAAFVPGGRTVVVLTLRADFYQKCAAYPFLSARLAEQQFLVSPMSLNNLRQTIEEPAWLVGLEFEAGLVATILDDVENQPGALPLLEHALLELWKLRRGGMLTLEGYRESGRVAHAIATRAETIFKSFKKEQQEIMRRVMLRLTQPGENTEDTRRRAAMSELVTRSEESVAVESVVKELTDAHLLLTSKDEQTDEPLVEVAHEALIRGWPRLRQWLDEDRAGLLVHRRLTDAVQEWRRLGKNDSVLYRGPVLALAVEWQNRNEGMCSAIEREFLQASRARQTEERRKAESRWRLGEFINAGVVLAFLIIGGVAFFFYYRAKDRAEEVDQHRAQAEDVINERLRLERSVEDTSPYFQAILRGHSDEVNTANFSPDGKLIVTASDDGSVKLWNEAGHSLDTFFVERNSIFKGRPTATFAANGKYIVAANYNTLSIWDAASGSLVDAITCEPTVDGKRFDFNPVAPAWACSHDGRCIVTDKPLLVDKEISVSMWHLFAKPYLGRGFRDNPRGAAFSPDGNRIATLSGNWVRVWTAPHATDMELGKFPEFSNDALREELSWLDRQKAPEKISEFSVGPTNSVAVSPDGHLITTNSVAFSPDSKRIITASSDKAAYIWQASNGQRLAELCGHTRSVNSAAYSPDGKFIVTASDDGTARVWDANNGRSLNVLYGHIGRVYSAVFSPAGKYIATASADGTARIWKHPASH